VVLMTNEPVPAALADLVLDDEHGAGTRLGDLWRDRPIVIVFIRHFG
jgi:hypothetical protein